MTHSHSHGPAALRAAILDLLAACGPGKSISPFDAARALVGSDERQWSRLMKPLRAVAVDMANAGELEIRRKGKIMDPSNFRGVYRLALPDPNAQAKTEAGRDAGPEPEAEQDPDAA